MSSPFLIYGPKRSRAFRVLWMCEEVGAPYENVHIALEKGEGRTSEHLSRHPLGKIPVLERPDGTRLFESSAILTWLGDTHPDAQLVPEAGSWERGLYDQWLSFANTELDAPMWTRALHSRVLPPDQRVPAVLPVCEAMVQRGCRVLETELAERPFILERGFSPADILIAHTLVWATANGIAIGDGLEGYLNRLKSRPAYQAVGRRR
ncbi:MAG: glutathione S-transferase family protein [Myxococcota bacterium]